MPSPIHRPQESVLRRLYAHFAPHHARIRTATLFSVLNKLFDLAPPMLIGLAVDVVVAGLLRRGFFLAPEEKADTYGACSSRVENRSIHSSWLDPKPWAHAHADAYKAKKGNEKEQTKGSKAEAVKSKPKAKTTTRLVGVVRQQKVRHTLGARVWDSGCVLTRQMMGPERSQATQSHKTASTLK